MHFDHEHNFMVNRPRMQGKARGFAIYSMQWDIIPLSASTSPVTAFLGTTLYPYTSGPKSLQKAVKRPRIEWT